MANDGKDIKPDTKNVDVDYSTLAKLFPTYDGNPRTLAFYIEGVENVLELVTSKDDLCITTLIRNKLTGKRSKLYQPAQVPKPGFK